MSATQFKGGKLYWFQTSSWVINSSDWARMVRILAKAQDNQMVSGLATRMVSGLGIRMEVIRFGDPDGCCPAWRPGRALGARMMKLHVFHARPRSSLAMLSLLIESTRRTGAHQVKLLQGCFLVFG
jgi:hypothetical protein